MLDGKRKLRYIPLFYNDLENAADYIANTVGNVQAAIELLDKVEVAILNRLPIADAFEPYPSRKRTETGLLQNICRELCYLLCGFGGRWGICNGGATISLQRQKS